MLLEIILTYSRLLKGNKQHVNNAMVLTHKCAAMV